MTRVDAMKFLRNEGWFERVEPFRRKHDRLIRATVTFLGATPDSASAATLLLDEVLGLVGGVTDADLRVRPRAEAVFCHIHVNPRFVTQEDLRLLVNLSNEHTGRTNLPTPCELFVGVDEFEEGEAR